MQAPAFTAPAASFTASLVASFTSPALVSTLALALAAAESNFTFAESRATLAESTFALTAESTSLTASLVSDFLQATNARAATAATNNDFS